jgi:predicted SprT family Zn-dependent metalloprotease
LMGLLAGTGYPSRGRPGRIELSKHYVLRNPEHEVLDTILHEIAHALVGPGHGHDEVWKAKCVEVGGAAGAALRRDGGDARGAVAGDVRGCGREHDRHRRPKKLTGWWCRRCGKERGGLVWKTVG